MLTAQQVVGPTNNYQTAKIYCDCAPGPLFDTATKCKTETYIKLINRYICGFKTHDQYYTSAEKSGTHAGTYYKVANGN